MVLPVQCVRQKSENDEGGRYMWMPVGKECCTNQNNRKQGGNKDRQCIKYGSDWKSRGRDGWNYGAVRLVEIALSSIRFTSVHLIRSVPVGSALRIWSGSSRPPLTRGCSRGTGTLRSGTWGRTRSCQRGHGESRSSRSPLRQRTVETDEECRGEEMLGIVRAQWGRRAKYTGIVDIKFERW